MAQFLSQRRSAVRDLLAAPPPDRLRTLSTLTRADLATGRGLTYEWEFWIDQVLQQLSAVGAGPQTFEHQQVGAASVWNINHGLSAYPSVLVIDNTGQELLAEVHYPNDGTVVVIHGKPYAGTAYLRV